MRASTRSPMPAGGAVSRRLSTMRMRGGGPFSSSQVAGRAKYSPSRSRPVISSTVTGGSAPGRVSLRREPAIRPSSAISRNSSFSATRSPPFTPKARAISRLPASPVVLARKSRMSCFEGSLPVCLLRARGPSAPLGLATAAAQPAVSSTASLLLFVVPLRAGDLALTGDLAFAVFLAAALAGFFLAGPLAARAVISATASSIVTSLGTRSLGRVALTLPCFT